MTEASFPRAELDRNEAFARLVHWVEREGGKVERLALGQTDGGERGLYAARPVAPADVLLRIPHACLLTQKRAFSSSIGQKLAASGVVPETSHTWLAALLLEEALQPSSRFRPYLDLLPISYSFMPILFEREELDLLRGSFTLARILERRETLSREYEFLTRLVPALRAYRIEQFVWARLTVITRIFGITVDGEKTVALVPVADLMNHGLPRGTNWGYAGNIGAFAMTAVRGFSVGEQVHDSYGRKCNSRFFLNYGFALAENEENEAMLIVDSEKGLKSFLVSARPEAESTRSMIAALELQSSEPEGRKRGEHVRRMIADACEKALAAFGTTLAEDEALLENPALRGNARTCILMRRGEKQVLHSLLRWTRG